jgi:hypothetical protein
LAHNERQLPNTNANRLPVFHSSTVAVGRPATIRADALLAGLIRARLTA